MNCSFYGKTMEIIGNRIEIELVEKDFDGKLMKMQVKLTFYCIYKLYDIYGIYNEILMYKSYYLRFAVFELSKLLMYETYWDKIQKKVRKKYINCHYIDTNAFVFSINARDNMENLYNLRDSFDFSNLSNDRETFSKKNEKVFGNFRFETPENVFWMNSFVQEVKRIPSNVEVIKQSDERYL